MPRFRAIIIGAKDTEATNHRHLQGREVEKLGTVDQELLRVGALGPLAVAVEAVDDGLEVGERLDVCLLGMRQRRRLMPLGAHSSWLRISVLSISSSVVMLDWGTSAGTSGTASSTSWSRCSLSSSSSNSHSTRSRWTGLMWTTYHSLVSFLLLLLKLPTSPLFHQHTKMGNTPSLQTDRSTSSS